MADCLIERQPARSEQLRDKQKEAPRPEASWGSGETEQKRREAEGGVALFTAPCALISD